MPIHGVIEKAENFLYFDDKLCESIEEWAARHCDTFNSSNSEEQEQPLEHMSLYADYVRLFESLIESFLVSENISLELFYNTVRNEYEAAQWLRRESTTFTSILLGSLEYSFLCDLMYNVKIGQGVVFCPPSVSEENLISHHIHDNASAAMPRREVIPPNEYKYLHKLEQSEKNAGHKLHK